MHLKNMQPYKVTTNSNDALKPLSHHFTTDLKYLKIIYETVIGFTTNNNDSEIIPKEQKTNQRLESYM